MHNITSQQTDIIRPLYGMRYLWPASFLVFFLLVIALVVDGTARTVSVVAALLVFILLVLLVYNRLSRPWKRLHYPLMNRIGELIVDRDKQYPGVQRDAEATRELLRELLRELYHPHADDMRAEMLKRAERRMQSFSDRDGVAAFLQDKNPTIQQDTLTEVLQVIKQDINAEENFDGVVIRYLVGEIIEREYGPEERTRYICEVISGRT